VVQLVHILVKGILRARMSERLHAKYGRAQPRVKHWPVLCGPPPYRHVMLLIATLRLRHTADTLSHALQQP
jgi:hypothetical protein